MKFTVMIMDCMAGFWLYNSGWLTSFVLTLPLAILAILMEIKLLALLWKATKNCWQNQPGEILELKKKVNYVIERTIPPDLLQRVIESIYPSIFADNINNCYLICEGANGGVVTRNQAVKTAHTLVETNRSLTKNRPVVKTQRAAPDILKIASQRYQALVKATCQIVWVADAQGMVVEDLPTWRAYTGQTVEECLGRGWLEAIHPQDKVRSALHWNRALESKTIYEDEYQLRDAEGNYRHFLVRGVPVLAADGSIQEWVGVNTDITPQVEADTIVHQLEIQYKNQAKQLETTEYDLEKTQAQLIQIQKFSCLGQLVTGVIREINNPVNFIAGNMNYVSKYMEDLLLVIELYQRNYPQPVPEIESELLTIDMEFLLQDLPKLLTSIRLSSDRIQDFMFSLQNFSRLDQTNLKQVDLNQEIESILVILEHRFNAKSGLSNIQVIKDFGNLPLVECYLGQINQVLLNILLNAVDALEESWQLGWAQGETKVPQIHISTANIDQDLVSIHVWNNGPEIPLEMIGQIFEPFFTTKPTGKGAGLGLAISYQIVVEKHRGNLKCVSLPEQGTEFIIEIPIHQSC